MSKQNKKPYNLIFKEKKKHEHTFKKIKGDKQ